jgi:hypothetical protein
MTKKPLLKRLIDSLAMWWLDHFQCYACGKFILSSNEGLCNECYETELNYRREWDDYTSGFGDDIW